MMLVFQSLMYFSPSLSRHQEQQALTGVPLIRNSVVTLRLLQWPAETFTRSIQNCPSERRGAPLPEESPLSVRNTGLEPAHPAGASAGLGSLTAVLATALASSSRRMRREVTGAAARPIAPQAQNAHWKPLVSAAAGAAPWWSRLLAWVAAIVDAMATPIAPPSCWEVLMSPEARPASCSATPARAAIETGMKANAVPIPTTMNGPARLPQKFPCTGTWVAHRMPPPIMAMPAAITSLAEPRVTSACDRPAKATEVSDAASQARPAFSAEYPSTCCRSRVPMKMKAKKLRPSGTLTAFAPASVLFWKIRSGISGASTRVSRTTKAASRAADTASSVTVLAVPHPTCGAVEIA